MKSKFLSLLSFFAVIFTIFVLCACRPQDSTSAHEHKFLNFVSDGNATCTEDGTKTAKCTGCNKTQTITDTDSRGHRYTEVSKKEADCTEDGYIITGCTGCNYSKVETLHSEGHKVGEFILSKEPTCDTKGEKSGECESCGEFVTVAVSAKGHTLDEKNLTDEYCGGQRIGTISCLECKEVVVTFGHTYEKTALLPTCTDEGSNTYLCSNCGDTYTEKVEAYGHYAGDWALERDSDCTHEGSTVQNCRICSIVLASHIVEKKQHIYNSEARGSEIVYTCLTCSDSYTEKGEEQYTVTLSTGDGTQFAPISVVKGGIPKLPSPELSGYEFVGWYTDAELKNPYDTEGGVYGDMTLYAGYRKEYIEGEYASNSVISDVSTDFTFKIKSEIELTDSNLSEHIEIYDRSGVSPSLYIVSKNGNEYTVGSREYKSDGSYNVTLGGGLSFSDTAGNELWFMMEKENQFDVEYKSGVVVISADSLYMMYEENGQTVIFLREDLLNTGDIAVIRGEREDEIYAAFDIIGESRDTLTDSWIYAVEDANPEDVFESIDVHYNGELSVESFEFNENLEEELAEAVENSAFYERVKSVAALYAASNSTAKYRYNLKDIKTEPKTPRIEDCSIIFNIKISVEFERIDIATGKGDSAFTIVLDLGTTFEFYAECEINSSDDFMFFVEIRNETDLNIYLSTGSSDECKTELPLFKEMLEYAQSSGSYPELDSSSVSQAHPQKIGSVKFNVYGINLGVTLSNIFAYEFSGEMGISNRIETSYKVGFSNSPIHGAKEIKSFKSEAYSTMYVMAKIEFSDLIELKLSVNLLGCIAKASISGRVGPYFVIGGMFTVTMSSSSDGVSAIKDGYFEAGIRTKILLEAKLLVWEKSWEAYNKDIPLYKAGDTKVPLYFNKATEDAEVDYTPGISIDISKEFDENVVYQDFIEFKKVTEEADCNYYLVGNYEGVWLSPYGLLTVYGNAGKVITLEIKVRCEEVYKTVTLTVTVLNNETGGGGGTPDDGTTDDVIPDDGDDNEEYQGELTYELNSDGTYTITGVKSQDVTRVSIPKKINGISVTRIGDCAFLCCTELKSVTIPDGVTSIGVEAFCECTGLTSITIPDSVTRIGYDAFSGCTGLTSVTIPNSVTSIGGGAFFGCTELKSVTIPDGVTSIGEDAFSGCTNLKYNEYDNAYYLGNENNPYLVLIEAKNTSITSCGINSNTKFIHSAAFYQCTGLTSITIPNSVTSIGSAAFVYCTGLTSVTIPNSVTSIGSSAFSDCTGLTSITIPGSVLSLGSSAFEGCTGLESVTFGENSKLESIGYSAFEDCTGLESIILPFVGATKDGTSNTYFGYIFGASYSSDNDDYVPTSLKTVVITGGESIDEDAFYNCEGLTSITIPNSVTSIGEDAFRGCTGLKEVHISDIAAWCNIDFANDTSNPLCYYAKNLYLNEKLITELIIPEEVTEIPNDAFKNQSSITSVTIPSTVTSIGEDAFRGCSSLAEVHISDIAAWCNIDFDYYSSNPLYDSNNAKLYLNGELITELVIPEGVTEIPAYAFKNQSSITSVTIPSTVTSISSSAFYGCTGIKEVHISDIAAWCNIDFIYYYSNPLYYADNATLYLNGSPVTELEIPDGVIEIKDSAFLNLSSITSVTISSTVTSIGSSAFYGCTGLESVTFGENSKLESIGSSAFSGCTGLESVTFGENSKLESIGYSAFSGCTGLTSITIPDSVTSIGGGAFSECSNLESITIPDSVTSIGEYAFDYCTGLESVTFGENSKLESIGYYAFYGCTELTSITIPDSVTSIGEYAFYGCTGLTSVKFANTSGWWVSEDYSATSGTSVDVTNAAQNAIYLKNTYSNLYWKRG